MNGFFEQPGSMYALAAHVRGGVCVRLFVAAVLIAVFVRPKSGFSQTTKPAVAGNKISNTASSAFEEEPLQGDTASATASGIPSKPASSNGDSFNSTRLMIALAIVIFAIFGVKWAGQKFFLLPERTKSCKGLKVLSRSILAPKQQVLLLQVGKRVIVVGDSGGSMTALCQITDPEEISALVGELATESPKPATSFSSLFGRAKQPFDVDGQIQSSERAGLLGTEESNIEVGLGGNSEDVGELIDKIRSMRQQFKRDPQT